MEIRKTIINVFFGFPPIGPASNVFPRKTPLPNGIDAAGSEKRVGH